MIGIIDYDAGNIQSVVNALDFVGSKCKIIKDPQELMKCDKLILPGVGAYKEAMTKLKNKCLDEAILEFIKAKKPFLGICLGMQLLFEYSFEFGQSDGLGIIPGKVIKFDSSKFNKPLKIPHMGWNMVNFTKQTKINKGIENSAYFYFVHSYHAICDEKFILSTTNYGYSFVSGVQLDNVFGFQPHPEKSHENGLKIIKNFVEL